MCVCSWPACASWPVVVPLAPALPAAALPAAVVFDEGAGLLETAGRSPAAAGGWLSSPPQPVTARDAADSSAMVRSERGKHAVHVAGREGREVCGRNGLPILVMKVSFGVWPDLVGYETVDGPYQLVRCYNVTYVICKCMWLETTGGDSLPHFWPSPCAGRLLARPWRSEQGHRTMTTKAFVLLPGEGLPFRSDWLVWSGRPCLRGTLSVHGRGQHGWMSP